VVLDEEYRVLTSHSRKNQMSFMGEEDCNDLLEEVFWSSSHYSELVNGQDFIPDKMLNL